MKLSTKKRFLCLASVVLLVLTGWLYEGITVNAAEDSFDLDAGAADLLKSDLISDQQEIEALIEAKAKEEAEKYKLVIANVENSVNVRKEANSDSEIAGKLYKNCGGEILEKGDGWTKIQSGNLIGWVSNVYLYFNEEAQVKAKEVGITVATVNCDALRARKDASEEAGVYTLLERGLELDVVEEQEAWVSVEYNSKTLYVAKDYVLLSFFLPEGETTEEIQEREHLEALEKAKLTTNLGAISATDEEITLLAAIIQCEAGNQSAEGKLAVGAVVANRVRSSRFPGTITEVVYSPGQFTPASNGRLAARLEAGPSESCYEAARAAIAGETNVGTAHYFRRKGNKTGIIIGAHVFW